MRLMLVGLLVAIGLAGKVEARTAPHPAATHRHAEGSADPLVAATPLAGAPGGASAFKLRYRSVDPRGRPVVVTGIGLVPRGAAPAGGRDIVVWSHGAVGIANACAPSAARYRFAQIAGLEALLAAGYIVVAPDYQGLGSPGPHPFLVGDATAHVVLDAARAARRLPKAHASTRFALWGESQGGHAALWAAKRARSYAPELTLVGVAAAAPVTDLKADLVGGGNAVIRAFLTAYAAESWSRVYGVPLTGVVKPRTAKLIGALAKNCIGTDGFKLGTKIGMVRLAHQLKDVDLAANPRWAALMARNSVSPGGLHVPVLIVQGSKDQIVAPAVTRKFVAQLCRRGANVTSVTDNGDHVTAGKRGAAVAVSWLGERFAGSPATSDCK